jgi:hypothetical protein
MTENEFLKALAKAEGKKVQVSYGNLKEVWKIIKAANKESGGAIEQLLMEDRMAKKKSSKKVSKKAVKKTMKK